MGNQRETAKVTTRTGSKRQLRAALVLSDLGVVVAREWARSF